MKRLTNLVVLFFALTMPCMAQSLTAEQAVLDLSARKFAWLIDRQYDSLEKLFDERIQYVHSNGWVQNRKDLFDDSRSGKLVYKKVTIKEAAARVYDKSAIVTGLGTFEGTNAGNAFTLDLRYTEVYVKDGRRWKLASRHSNRMP